MRPALARGLQALLDYSGDDVEDVFCRSFVGDYEAWGEVQEVPLIEGGASVPVTNANRAGSFLFVLSAARNVLTVRRRRVRQALRIVPPRRWDSRAV